MPGGSKKGGGLKTKKSAFYLKSGNKPTFKEMGSSPLYTHEGREHTTEAEEEAHRAIDREIREYNRETTERTRGIESERSEERQEEQSERTKHRSRYLREKQKEKERKEEGIGSKILRTGRETVGGFVDWITP